MRVLEYKWIKRLLVVIGVIAYLLLLNPLYQRPEVGLFFSLPSIQPHRSSEGGCTQRVPYPLSKEAVRQQLQQNQKEGRTYRRK